MENKKGKFEVLAERVGQTVEKKNAAYGSAFLLCGDFLKILYPTGVPPHQYRNMLLLVRMFDKMCRIANGNGQVFNEDAWEDLAGYSLLGLSSNDEPEFTSPQEALDAAATEEAAEAAKGGITLNENSSPELAQKAMDMLKKIEEGLQKKITPLAPIRDNY